MTAEVQGAARPTLTTPAAAPSRARGRRTNKVDRSRPAPLSQALLTLVLLVFMVPFVWMVATSLKPGSEVFASPPSLVGSQLRFANFSEAWSYVPFGRYMANGMVVAVLGTLLVCVTSILAAYAFARLEFKGRELIFLLYLITLMVPQEVMIVPMFILMQQLGWTNSYQALILPWAFSAFGTFLLRQFFLNIPKELEEAALVDGANRLRILTSIVLPIARPAVAVLAVFTFINYWNSFLWPLIITNSTDLFTVPVGLNGFLGQQGSQWHLLMAASTISMLPTVVIVLLLQRHLVRGIALSGLGGR
ncbi:carbohydrate ABC transporter permease [Microlunatus flavus]|uniref:Multiple sugar transport system permease protein n=1 Tax=Microlunatus flavus TaxID=1036181 RepID=A0A1H9B1E8_9ACTN|nr:carbohydrate ABC transporter permease [Microlunatus flavus]SEP82689.1 multiple sugar transport system permease protein [Microlunatus flavus]